ncbi:MULTISPECIES: malonyl-ACP O-methyltransferase BioC [Methylotenera]|uniref:malonyl-ACP O-methyltransferase BioC n=1 Tax=Methylotenera TaxID=359407 RepID=UPI00036D26EC|nr:MULTISPECIES: malonyl-ACP O-methyltransferase BioC [Methylotenera]
MQDLNSQDQDFKDGYWMDKARVRASFDRAAQTYDAAAILQKLVRTEMLSRLDLVKIKPKVILDAGCGTGHGSFALQKKFSRARVVSLDIALGMLQKTHQQQPVLKKWLSKLLRQKNLICADIERLPIVNNSLGMVWSNLALQWCNDLDAAFSEVSRVLQPNGLFMFSTFGPDTLKELRVASRSANSETSTTRVSRFIDMHDIGDALTRAGFSAPVLDVERYTLTYDDVKSVMKDLKSIGAHNATQGRARGLQGRGFLQQLTQQYEQFRQAVEDGGKLPATFEVVYGHAWKADTKNGLNSDLGVGVSPITFKTYK